ncbi:MAG: C4-dicarboxylate ABC transporter permease [Rhodospirillaceae bacterium]|nr:C4-dicarboxylate ABC transporter permease [Rhodospirillaceae bacterium]MAX62285.1 C4-dicarboxylate ABC transporter permease [Rhodospirillaceae bacterium]|tara:strand:+ start:2228 stop:3496 length:1269 start_codon:yes stop_codon:yes gene_type:complete
MIIALALLILLFLIGTPIAFGLGIAPLIALEARNIPLLIVPQIAFEALDSFVLMAIPFFILAGRLMQAGGVAKRLVDLAIVLTGWMRGGLASASVVTSMFFATMSGSSSATAAAVGTGLIPEMERSRYPRPFAAATIAASAELGAIIPPSVPMIVYAVVAGVSITDLFIAGVVPGLLIGLSLIAFIYVIAMRRDYGVLTTQSVAEWASDFRQAFKRAALPLLIPVIVLGGIYGGIFTPTEAAVVSVFYAMVLGIGVYRTIGVGDLPKILADSALTSAIVLIIVGFASVFAYALSIHQVPQTLAAQIIAISSNPFVFLLMVNIVLLLVGMFIETLAAVIVVTPILAPIAVSLGIDPIHFGIVVIVNLAIGMVTPPVGVNLFIVSQIADTPIERLIKPLLGFMGVLVIDLLLISYLPLVMGQLL